MTTTLPIASYQETLDILRAHTWYWHRPSNHAVCGENCDWEYRGSVQQCLDAHMSHLGGLLYAEPPERPEPRYAEFQEGDEVLLKVKIARANKEQAFIGFESMDGPYSIRVPLSELRRV